MAVIPPVQKSWQRVFNVDSTNDRKKLILDKKNILFGVAFGGMQITSNPWFAVKSSNGSAVVAGDNWTTTGDINQGNAAGSNARSWMLMQNALGQQWLWDYRGVNADEIYLSMSPAGLFTGGTTTAAPTAVDQLKKDPSAGSHSLYDTLAGSSAIRQNVLHSSDGKQTIIFTCQNGTSSTLWMFGVPEDPPSDWAHPCIMWADQTTNDQTGGTFSNHLRGFSGGIHITGEGTPGVFGSLHFVAQDAVDIQPLGGGTGCLLNIKNELTNEWDIYEKSWLTGITEAAWGPLGYWPDLCVTAPPQTGGLTGDHFPGDGSRQWVKFNDLLLYWGGAAAMVVPT